MQSIVPSRQRDNGLTGSRILIPLGNTPRNEVGYFDIAGQKGCLRHYYSD